MAADEPDSTAEVGEVDREWERTSLSHPEDAKARNVSGAIEETDDELAADLADDADIAAKLRGDA